MRCFFIVILFAFGCQNQTPSAGNLSADTSSKTIKECPSCKNVSKTEYEDQDSTCNDFQLCLKDGEYKIYANFFTGLDPGSRCGKTEHDWCYPAPECPTCDVETRKKYEDQTVYQFHSSHPCMKTSASGDVKFYEYNHFSTGAFGTNDHRWCVEW